MPGPILHLGAHLTCSHGGQATPIALFHRVTVRGQPILTLSTSFNISGCAVLPENEACKNARFISGSARVFAGGTPVLIQGSTSICEPSGLPILVVAVQARTNAI